MRRKSGERRQARRGRERVLILTLENNESEYRLCCASVREQKTGASLTHEVIQGLKSREAHQALYKRISETRKFYDIFIKLDADMVFATETAVDIILEQFRDNNQLDHVEFAVDDFFTGGPLMGAHAFSAHVSWTEDSSEIFVDPQPSFEGQYRRITNCPLPLILHAPDPSRMQAFEFGVHRGVKIWQPGVLQPEVGHSYHQFHTVKKVLENWKRSGDSRLALALMGCEAVRTRDISVGTGDRSQPQVVEYFNSLAETPPARLMVPKIYQGWIGWMVWLWALRPYRVAKYFMGKAIRKTVKNGSSRIMAFFNGI